MRELAKVIVFMFLLTLYALYFICAKLVELGMVIKTGIAMRFNSLQQMERNFFIVTIINAIIIAVCFWLFIYSPATILILFALTIVIAALVISIRHEKT